VGHFAQGMIVQVPLQLWALPGQPSAADVHGALAKHYADSRFVTVADQADTARLAPEALNGTNELRLHVFEGEGQAVVMALLDNLGKGASGSCVQNLNIMLGMDEGVGL
ncbi:MAG TPA: N-acetyl-gamma-glutamyl-phosphate reductase, partial [Magnetovibrio sp.]